MTIPANIRLNLGVPFPAFVQGAGGIVVSKTNGVWTIAPAGGAVPSVGTQNTWTALQTFNNGIAINPPAFTLTPGLSLTQSALGNSTGGFNANVLSIADVVNAGANFSVGLNVILAFGNNANTFGGREAIQGQAALNGPTSPTNTNRNYVGVQGVGSAVAGDNGTGLTIGTAAGNIFGGGFIGALFTGATNFQNVTGAEFNCFIQTGASAALKSLLQVSADPRDRVQGSLVDAMFWAYNQSGSNPGWNTGILFDNAAGIGAWPIISTGTIIKTGGGGTAANGIDFSNTTFSGSAFKSTGFSVDGSGNLTAAAVTATALNVASQVITSVPTTLTGASGSIGASYSYIINNAGGAFTLTLPAPSAINGRWLRVKATGTTTSVVSASSNVVPIGGGAAGTAILSAAGKWADLQSDGSNWIVMAAN